MQMCFNVVVKADAVTTTVADVYASIAGALSNAASQAGAGYGLARFVVTSVTVTEQSLPAKAIKSNVLTVGDLQNAMRATPNDWPVMLQGADGVEIAAARAQDVASRMADTRPHLLISAIEMPAMEEHVDH